MATVRGRTTKICSHCGESFSITKSEVKKGRGKYCGLQCKRDGWRKSVVIKCLTCGKEFITNKANAYNDGRKYCSHKCYSKSISINFSGANNPKYQGGDVEKVCLVCGVRFMVDRSRHNLGNVKCCSYKCMGKFQSKNRAGENHPRWIGGCEDDNLFVRGSRQSVKWRQDVFVRDNFTCVKCGQHGGDLEAHHIKRFSDLIKEAKNYLPLFDIRVSAFMYSPLWDISNGVVLCKKCHRDEHRKH